VLVERGRTLDEVGICPASVADGMTELGPGLERRDVDRRVLVNLYDLAALRPDDLEQAVATVVMRAMSTSRAPALVEA
jgi:hypothetical protein